MQQEDSHQDRVDDPQHLKHYAAADPASAAPTDSCPFTPRLQHMQSGAVLFALDKAVVGKRIQPEPAGMAFTIAFRLVEEFHHMGRKAIYIERYEKAHRIHVGEQSQNFLKILPTAEGHHLLSGARKKLRRFISRPPLTAQ